MSEALPPTGPEAKEETPVNPSKQNPVEKIKKELEAAFPGKVVERERADFDDGHKPIEAMVRISAKSITEVQGIVKTAERNGFGVMVIGSKTSAVGAFAAQNAADLHSLHGYIGLEILEHGTLELMSKKEYETSIKDGEIVAKAKLIKEGSEIEVDSHKFEVISALKNRLYILKSKNHPKVPHRLRTYAGVTPAEIDDALQCLPGKSYKTTGLDLTTRGQAQIGGATSTGSQGPNRGTAEQNLTRVAIVNGEGEIEVLKGDEAKMQVGLGGLGGAIMELELEVIEEPLHEFGMFIPLPGTTEAGLTEKFPEIMALLAKFAEFETGEDNIRKPKHGSYHEDGKPKGPEFLIKGFEIISQKGLQKAHGTLENSKKRSAGRAGKVNQFMYEKGCAVGLMINGRTHLTAQEVQEKINEFICKFIEPSESTLEGNLGMLLERGILHKEDDEKETEDFFKTPGTEIFGGVSEMNDFREIREEIAVVARESKKLGPTKSTDLNVRVKTEGKTPEQIKGAYQKIWAIYYSYIKDLGKDGGGREAKIDIYGHNHPGVKNNGGGVDAHLRVTFPLKENGHQERAAENMAYLSERQARLYKELIALDSEDGIEVAPGEKGLFMNPYWVRYMEENEPERTEKLWKYIQEHGGDTFGNRENKLRLHAYPARIKKGILNYFAGPPHTEESIMRWCENSHRSPEGEKVFGEVHGLIRDWLELGFNDRVFFAESTEKAIHTSVLSLTDYKNGKKELDLRSKSKVEGINDSIDTVILNKPEQLDHPSLQDSDIKTILVIDDDKAVDAKTREKVDVVVYSTKKFGTNGDMGIIVTNIETVKHARKIKAAGNHGDYVHSFDKLNEKPHSSIETPPMQIIAELGCKLAKEKLEQECELTPEKSEAIIEEQKRKTTLNPGPSKNNEEVIGQSNDIEDQLRTLEVGRSEDRIRSVEEVKSKLKKYLGIPEDYEIFFGGSATQAMQQITESLALHQATVLNSGPFGARQEAVARHFGRNVNSVKMRWATGPSSRLESKAAEIRENEKNADAKNRLGRFMTGHETGTGAQIKSFSDLVSKLDKNFLNIVDGTSEIGGVDRSEDFENGSIDVYFGSVQKFLGLPAGLSIMAVSPKAMKAAKETQEEREDKIAAGENLAPTYRTFFEMMDAEKDGEYHNLRGILQLGVGLDEYLERGMGAIVDETRRKMEAIGVFVDDADEVEWVVKEEEDRSELLAHLVLTEKLAESVRAEMRKLGFEIGGGYGPYAGETIRVYLSPNVSEEGLKKAIEALRISIGKAQSEPEVRPLISYARTA